MSFALEQIKEKNEEVYFLKQELSKLRRSGNDSKNQTINFKESNSGFKANKSVCFLN